MIFFSFSLSFHFNWEDMSNDRDSVTSAIQAPQILSKILHCMSNLLLLSVFGYPAEALSLMFDILHEKLTKIQNSIGLLCSQFFWGENCVTSNKTATEETRNPSVFTSKKSEELLILFKLTQKVNKDKKDLEQWKRSNTAICLDLCQSCHDKIPVWFNWVLNTVLFFTKHLNFYTLYEQIVLPKVLHNWSNFIK